MGSQKTAILAQVGQVYLGAVGQFCIGVNTFDPDLVLLDLMMPGMSGYAVLEQLERLRPANEFRPVLVLTADATTAAKRRALSLGAKDFLTKPFDPIEAMLRVWNLLETRMLHKQLRRLVPDGALLPARSVMLR